MKEKWLVCFVNNGKIEVVKSFSSIDSAKSWVEKEGFGAYYIMPAFLCGQD